jgi:iron complex transport system substrate-binding protein
MRIVSLIPSATEIVCALGFADQLVGRSHECDYPLWVEKLPICSQPKFVPESSREIDEYVRKMVHDALSIYQINSDRLKQLEPDLIITQSQCEVCAVSLEDVERATCEWLNIDAHIVSLEPNGLDDVFEDVRQVASALGVPERGDQQIETMRGCMADIAKQTSTIADKPTVACLEWLDPLMSSGNWMPSLVEMAGGVNLFGKPDKHSPRLPWEDLQAADPDVIICLPCGFSMQRGKRDLPILQAMPGWNDLKAVREQQVYLTDGHQYFNRPGPRLVDSLEILAEIIHPEHFHFDHEGLGWQRL